MWCISSGVTTSSECPSLCCPPVLHRPTRTLPLCGSLGCEWGGAWAGGALCFSFVQPRSASLNWPQFWACCNNLSARGDGYLGDASDSTAEGGVVPRNHRAVHQRVSEFRSFGEVVLFVTRGFVSGACDSKRQNSESHAVGSADLCASYLSFILSVWFEEASKLLAFVI